MSDCGCICSLKEEKKTNGDSAKSVIVIVVVFIYWVVCRESVAA